MSYALVLTKADQVKPDVLAALIDTIAAALARHPAAYPEILPTSARTSAGIAELRAAIARVLKERAG